MSIEANKAIVRRFYNEIGNQRRYDVADEIIAPDFKMFPSSSPPYGPEGVKAFMNWFIDLQFPDLHITIDEMIGEGDVVAVNVTLRATQQRPLDWLGKFNAIPATGKPFALIEYVFWRIRNGQIVERWLLVDTLRMLDDLGITGYTARFEGQ